MGTNSAKKATDKGLELSKADIEKRVEEYKAKQADRFAKRLDARVERYEAQLKDKASAEHEIIIRRAKLDELKERYNDIRATMKTLRQEIKDIKSARKSSKSSKKQAAAS